MSKPDDVSQAAWDAAEKAMIDIAKLISNFVSSDTSNPPIDGFVKPTIARAILAAKAEEREDCALIADDDDGEHTIFGEDRNTRVAQMAARSIAAAIRARTP